VKGGSPAKLVNVASKGSLAGDDDDLSESKLLKSLRLAPLSMSSRDHRDGWLHMEPSVRRGCGQCAAASSPSAVLQTVRSFRRTSRCFPPRKAPFKAPLEAPSFPFVPGGLHLALCSEDLGDASPT